MSKKHKNPYRAGTAYAKVFDLWQKKQVVTFSQLAAAKVGTIHDWNVVLRPNKEGEGRGDCRGSYSAQGHLYYGERLRKQGQEVKYRLRWRTPPLEPKKRGDVTAVKAKKVKNDTAKTTKTTKTTKAKVKAKVKAKAKTK